MQLKFRTRLPISLLLLCASLTSFCQEDSSLLGDSLYRYSVILAHDIDINALDIRHVDFACVDKYRVRQSQASNNVIDLVNQAEISEFYAVSTGFLKSYGYRGADPFINVMDKEVRFFTPILLFNRNSLNNTTTKGNSEFVLTYQTKELPEPIKKYCEERGIMAIQANANVEWQSIYSGSIEFQGFQGTSEMHVTDLEWTYSIKDFRLRSDGWKNSAYGEDAFLKEKFRPRKIKATNLYQEDEVMPTISYYNFPSPKLYFNAREPIGNLPYCRHDKMDINVFPNPTYGDLNIQVENAESGQYVFAVQNIVGKKLWTKDFTINSEQYLSQFELPFLPKGVYLYSITDDEGNRIVSKRLVIIEP